MSQQEPLINDVCVALNAQPKKSASGSCGSEEDYLTIGALAKLCNVTVRTLRYYEETDLIGPVKRSSGQYRLYNSRSLHRVQAILALQELNFSLEEILTVLGPYSSSRSYTKEEQIAHTRESLENQKALILGKVARMTRMCEEIDARLTHLTSACLPCMEKSPTSTYCEESCSHLEVHD